MGACAGTRSVRMRERERKEWGRSRWWGSICRRMLRSHAFSIAAALNVT